MGRLVQVFVSPHPEICDREWKGLVKSVQILPTLLQFFGAQSVKAIFIWNNCRSLTRCSVHLLTSDELGRGEDWGGERGEASLVGSWASLIVLVCEYGLAVLALAGRARPLHLRRVFRRVALHICVFHSPKRMIWDRIRGGAAAHHRLQKVVAVAPLQPPLPP